MYCYRLLAQVLFYATITSSTDCSRVACLCYGIHYWSWKFGLLSPWPAYFIEVLGAPEEVKTSGGHSICYLRKLCLHGLVVFNGCWQGNHSHVHQSINEDQHLGSVGVEWHGNIHLPGVDADLEDSMILQLHNEERLKYWQGFKVKLGLCWYLGRGM